MAEGWVHDKLLGEHSANVNLALICMMGMQSTSIVQCSIKDQMQWMLLNPNGTREECVAHLCGCKMQREGVPMIMKSIP
jgi:hypothetical protein